MYSKNDIAYAMGSPIRKSTDQSLLTAPRGLSQPATSFIASECQGIHQMPFFYLIHAQKRKDPHKQLNTIADDQFFFVFVSLYALYTLFSSKHQSCSEKEALNPSSIKPIIYLYSFFNPFLFQGKRWPRDLNICINLVDEPLLSSVLLTLWF